MKFKTQLYCDKKEPLSDKSEPLFVTPYYLKFSKNKIYFTNEALKKAGSISNGLDPFNNGKIFRHTETYNLIRLDQYDVNRMKGSKFQIKLQSGTTINVASGGWNGMLMRLIHERYWVQKNKDWFIKTLIAAMIGFLFSLIGLYLGYRQGYENGIKVGKASRQDTALKR